MPNIRLIVDAEVSFTSGKFASREDIAQELIDQLSDPGSLTVNEGEYDVSNWEVSEEPVPSAAEVRAAQKLTARRKLLLSQAIDELQATYGNKEANARLQKLVRDLREAFNLPEPTPEAPGV